MDISPSRTSSPLALATGAAHGIGPALTTVLRARGIVRDTKGMPGLAERIAGRSASPVFADAGIGGFGAPA